MPDNTIIAHVCTECRLLAVTFWPKTKPNPRALFWGGEGDGNVEGFYRAKIDYSSKMILVEKAVMLFKKP